MTNKHMKKSLKRKAKEAMTVGLIGLTGLVSGCAGINSPLFEKTDGVTVREQVDAYKVGDSHGYTEIIGVAPGDNPIRNSWNEFFRVKHHHREVDEGTTHSQTIDYIAIGGKIPFDVGSVKNEVTVFANYGDKEGIGVESKHDFGKTRVTLNAEDSNLPREQQRLGFGLEHNLTDNWIVGVGYDSITNVDSDPTTGSVRGEYLLVNTQFKPNKNNMVGAAFRLANEEIQTKSALAYWGRYSGDSSNPVEWGHRTWLRHDWNDERDWKSTTLNMIVAQHPTFAPAAYSWLVGRGRGDMFDNPLVDSSMDAESVYLPERSNGGWVAEIGANTTESSGINSGYISGDLGYMFNLNEANTWQLGVVGGLDHRWRDDADSNNSASASVLLKNKYVFARAGVDVPISGGDTNTSYSGSVGFSIPLGAHRKSKVGDPLIERLNRLYDGKD